MNHPSLSDTIETINRDISEALEALDENPLGESPIDQTIEENNARFLEFLDGILPRRH